VTLASLSTLLAECPLVASVQPAPGVTAPVDFLVEAARQHQREGVRFLRLEGVEAIAAIRAATGLPCVGLLKRTYPDSDVFITPTIAEVEALIDLGCEVVAMDATERPRPGEVALADLVARVHAAGRLAMADCDTPASVDQAVALGFDVIGTTLSGYTPASSGVGDGPDLELVAHAVGRGALVLAEGRYQSEAQVWAAMRRGASGIVMGGALNDPTKQTRRFLTATRPAAERVGAVDLGGTWLRFAVVSASGEVASVERIARPETHEERLAWIESRVASSGVGRVGIAAGGTIHPRTGQIWESLGIIPGQIGESWALSVPTVALNDGLACAWGHAQHPAWAGRRVLTLAFGTGVGAGLVDQMRLLVGPQGEYPRLNDLRLPTGERCEDVLGGAALGREPDAAQREAAVAAAQYALRTARGLYHPEVVVMAGGVGTAAWLLPHLDDVELTPYGDNAGLMGAAWLALRPPHGM
jgi:N-acetylmannosamine-6-phosphate 2-epimerase/N-acetylmannosamine kinase